MRAPTDPHAGRDAGPDTVAPPRRLDVRSLVGVVLALVVGVGAVGRFVTAGRADRGPSPAGAVAAPTDRLATLEARAAARPDDAPTWQALAAAYTGRANATGDPAWYAAAERAAAQARRLAPGDVRTLVADAVVRLGVHDFAAAAEAAERAVVLDPYDADALAAAVDAAVELGDYERAEARLQSLLDVRPGAPALARVSYLRELHGDLPGALAAMARAEAAAVSAADRASIASYAGDLALAAGDLPAAEAAYARADTAVPGVVGADLGRARVALARGDLSGARARVDALVRRSPLPAAATLAADLAALAGDPAAETSARQLVDATTTLARDAGVRVDLEVALAAADRGDPAAVDLARRAYAERRTVFTADALAWALHRAGRTDEAVPLADEAVRLGTASAPLHVHAAAVYARAGRTDDAVAQLTAAFALSPWPSFALRPEAGRLAAALGVPVPDPWRS